MLSSSPSPAGAVAPGQPASLPLGGVLRHLGPGILLAATSIGASHILMSPEAGARFGLALVWLVVAAHLFKYPAFEAAPRWVAATGTSLLEAWHAAPGPRGWRRFSSLGAEQQVAYLDGWRTSASFPRRLLFTSLRAILTMGYFADEKVLGALGLTAQGIDSPRVEADLLWPAIGAAAAVRTPAAPASDETAARS